MNRAFKYRLYPTAEQRELFIKTFGCCRKVYNLMLAEKIESYKQTGKFATVTPAKYKKEYPYLKEVDSLALANKQLDLQKAFKIVSIKTVKRKPGFQSSSQQNTAESHIQQTIREPLSGYLKTVLDYLKLAL